MNRMDPREAARYWEGNAFAWTRLSRQGWDVYRDAVNTPAFLDLLPDVAGRRGLDVGCGEGHNTRLLARRGARMWAVDVAPTFVRFAREAERELIYRTLQHTRWNRREAAEILGISYKALLYKIKDAELDKAS